MMDIEARAFDPKWRRNRPPPKLHHLCNHQTKGAALRTHPVQTKKQNLIATPIKHALERSLKDAKNPTPGFLVVLSDPQWTGPIAAYLQSPMVKLWLEHFAEKTVTGSLALKEQNLKFIPIPKAMIEALEQEKLPQQDPRWRQMISEIENQPALITATLKALPLKLENAKLHATLFTRAARELEKLQERQRQLLAMVDETGNLNWRKFLSVLPIKDCMPFPVNPAVHLTGQLPPHHPIKRIEKISTQKSGILLSCEAGYLMQVISDDSTVLEMLWDQMKDLNLPTWNELTQTIFLPRKISHVREAAGDIMKAHATKMERVRDLKGLLEICSSF